MLQKVTAGSVALSLTRVNWVSFSFSQQQHSRRRKNSFIVSCKSQPRVYFDVVPLIHVQKSLCCCSPNCRLIFLTLSPALKRLVDTLHFLITVTVKSLSCCSFEFPQKPTRDNSEYNYYFALPVHSVTEVATINQ